MQDERFYDIPRYLNPPMRIFFLTPAELGLGIGLFLVFFFVLGMPITGIIVSVGSVMYFKRKKGGRQLDYFKRQLVWKGSPFPIMRCSNVRKAAFMRGASEFDGF